MKTKTLLLVIFASSFSDINSQDKLFNLVSNEACECLTKVEKGRGIADPDYKECLSVVMRNHLSALAAEVVKQYGTKDTYEKGQEYGRRLAWRLDTALVYTCDTYFRAADSLRLTFLNRYNKDSMQALYTKYKDGTLPENADYQVEKAKLSFFTGDYAETLINIEQAAKLLNDEKVLLVIKGLALDKVGKYKESASVFYYLEALSKEHGFLVYAAIENRKARDGKGAK